MITVKNLVKDYAITEKKEGLLGALMNCVIPKRKKIRAVDSISFKINAGEIVGYIGPNGAGKSTTIKMLTGILTPDSGEITVNGRIPYKNRIENNFNIGAVFGQRSLLIWDLAVIESYKLIRALYEIPAETYKKNIGEFTEILELKDLLSKPVRQLSLGQKMRCEIAAAFLHQPSIVYLDEPTIGLDVVVKDKIRNFIKEQNRQKKCSVILTTHDMQDIEEICRRIMIIDKGKIIYDGTISRIRELFGNIRTASFMTRKKDLNDNREVTIANTGNVKILGLQDNEIKVQFSRDKISLAAIIESISEQYEIIDLNVTEISIDSIIREIYRNGI